MLICVKYGSLCTLDLNSNDDDSEELQVDYSHQRFLRDTISGAVASRFGHQLWIFSLLSLKDGEIDPILISMATFLAKLLLYIA